MDNNMRDILDLLNEMSEEESNVELHDEFDIELTEDIVIESGVIDINEDGILIEGDDKALQLLEEHGLILEETDWSKYDEPTVSRIKKGTTKPVDRTDYNVPPAMRDKMQDKPGFEKRKEKLKQMGALDEGDSEIAFKATMPDLKNFFDLQSPSSNRISKMLDSVEFKQVVLNILTNDDLRNKFKEIFIKAMEMPISSFYSSALSSTDSKKDTSKKSEIDEAKYQGREVPLGKPMAGDVKKSKVYVKKPNGKVVKVNFGDKKMKIKKSNPKRRKSFRARHNCKNPGPRWKARYWSCRAW